MSSAKQPLHLNPLLKVLGHHRRPIKESCPIRLQFAMASTTPALRRDLELWRMAVISSRNCPFPLVPWAFGIADRSCTQPRQERAFNHIKTDVIYNRSNPQ